MRDTENRSKEKIPPKPIFFTKENLIALSIGTAMVVFFMWLLIDPPDKSSSDIFSDGICVLLIFIGIIFIWAVFFSYYHARKRYKLALQNYEEYERMIRNEEDELKRIHEEIERRTREREAEVKARKQEALEKLPVCPICGRKENVRRISTLNRSVSVAAFGLASSKIGKQYQCDYCNHLF